MIIRLAHKLGTRVKLGRLQPQELARPAIVDWSARSFRVGRVEYILLCNTSTFYCCVMQAKGINSAGQLSAAALGVIQKTLTSDGLGAVFDRFIAPSSVSITWATALNRTVTSSINELEAIAHCILADCSPPGGSVERRAASAGDELLQRVDRELNDHLLSALAVDKHSYRTPKEVMNLLYAQLMNAEGPATGSTAANTPDTERPITVVLPQTQRRILAELLPEWESKFEPQKTLWQPTTFMIGQLQQILEVAREESKASIGTRNRSLQGAVKSIAKAVDDALGRPTISSDQKVYQFKVALLNIEPQIWRRVQTTDCSLDKLHEHIQTAMGWTNSHLHHFIIEGKRYGDAELLHDSFDKLDAFTDSRATQLSDILPKDNSEFRFLYEYDFGDSWQHEVCFEGSSIAQPGQRYPVCTDGRRACPPEDSGGVWGYAEMLEALADAEHEEHEDYLEWIGPFDPEKFDPQAATRRMRRGLPNWRT